MGGSRFGRVSLEGGVGFGGRCWVWRGDVEFVGRCWVWRGDVDFVGRCWVCRGHVGFGRRCWVWWVVLGLVGDVGFGGRWWKGYGRLTLGLVWSLWEWFLLLRL